MLRSIPWSKSRQAMFVAVSYTVSNGTHKQVKSDTTLEFPLCLKRT